MPNLATVTAQAIGASNGLRVGVVLRVVGGQPVVDVGGAQISTAGNLSSYTPTAGDTVAVLRQESTWLILGRIVGTARRAATAVAEQSLANEGVVAVDGGDVVGAAAVTDTDFAASTGDEVPTGLVLSTVRMRAGVAYEVLVGVGYYSSAVGQYAQLRLRRGDPDGTILAEFGAHPVTAAGVVHAAAARSLLRTASDAAISMTVTLTGARLADPVVLTASRLTPAYLEVRPVGQADAFPHAITIAEEVR